MVVAIAYRLDLDFEETYGNAATLYHEVIIEGVADITEYGNKPASEIVGAMRRQYGRDTEVKIIGVDFLEVE